MSCCCNGTVGLNWHTTNENSVLMTKPKPGTWIRLCTMGQARLQLCRLTLGYSFTHKYVLARIIITSDLLRSDVLWASGRLLFVREGITSPQQWRGNGDAMTHAHPEGPHICRCIDNQDSWRFSTFYEIKRVQNPSAKVGEMDPRCSSGSHILGRSFTTYKP